MRLTDQWLDGIHNCGLIIQVQEKSMNIWTVKCREKRDGGQRGWHWRKYFGYGGRQHFSFGGPHSIKSSWSKKYIREDVTKGDVVVCYQVDGRSIVGLTRMSSDGLDSPPESGDFNRFRLAPARQGVAFDTPLSIAELRHRNCDPSCFRRGKQGTIFPVEPKDLNRIVALAIRLNPHLGEKLLAFRHNPLRRRQ